MKYSVGQTLYKRNNKTNQLEEVHVIDLLYKLDKSINQRYNHSEQDLAKLVDENKLFDNVDIAKEKAIKELEERFNIKLKEVE